jgi:hypothetical protein
VEDGEVIGVECHLVGVVLWCNVAGVTVRGQVEEYVGETQSNDGCEFAGATE